jgi:hypothetical protein
MSLGVMAVLAALQFAASRFIVRAALELAKIETASVIVVRAGGDHFMFRAVFTHWSDSRSVGVGVFTSNALPSS